LRRASTGEGLAAAHPSSTHTPQKQMKTTKDTMTALPPVSFAVVHAEAAKFVKPAKNADSVLLALPICSAKLA